MRSFVIIFVGILAGCFQSVCDERQGNCGRADAGASVDAGLASDAGGVGAPCAVDADCASGYCAPDHECRNSLLKGLVAYWALEQDGMDSTGNGSTLSSPGNAPTYSAGKHGNAAVFAITPIPWTNCSSLSAPANNYLDMSADFTVSMWARLDAAPYLGCGSFVVWSNGLFDNAQVNMWVARSTECWDDEKPVPPPAWAYATLALSAGPVDENDFVKLQSPTVNFTDAAARASWAHLIAYRRGDTVGLVVNGQRFTATVSGSVGTAKAFYLGGVHNNVEGAFGYPWQGAIDEVGKWNRALNDDEMSRLWNEGAGSYYPFP